MGVLQSLYQRLDTSFLAALRAYNEPETLMEPTISIQNRMEEVVQVYIELYKVLGVHALPVIAQRMERLRVNYMLEREIRARDEREMHYVRGL